MPKRLTRLNPYHPHTRLVEFRQRMKEEYRKLTTAQLDMVVNATFQGMTPAEVDANAHPEHRHQKLDFLLERASIVFKREWKTKYGWDFDDCYDNVKLQAAVNAMQDAQLKAEFPLKSNQAPIADPKELPLVDTTRIYTPTGLEINRAEFDVLSSDEQQAIRVHGAPHLTAICRSGYGGALSGGGLVDRRLYPQAIALQANAQMGTPAPLPVLNECPDGYEPKEGIYSVWEPYEQHSYLKAWARVRLKNGRYDLTWYWPNAGHFGPHKEEDVSEVQYFQAQDETTGYCQEQKVENASAT